MRFSSRTERDVIIPARLIFPLMILLAGFATSCGLEPGASGTFEKTLAVDGPVRFELSTGSGDVQIAAGPAGQVRIHGDFHVETFLFGGTQRRVEEIRANPPIEQHGNVINVGQEAQLLRNVSISYRITVPQETILRLRSGSGDVVVQGLKGPVYLGTGSGNITAESIGGDAELSTGSGRIRVKDVAGQVTANAGSGDIQLDNIHGAIRTRTGSGTVAMSHFTDRVQATTGSGDVSISDATADVRITAGSGDLTVSGNPSSQAYWELHTSSGGIKIEVPQSASFRLYARSNSGGIETNIPLTVEEKDRKSLRARAGSGAARIEAETGSGRIRIR
jgi:DUF4097 and DUF4098 domain-containing protein YvlB